MENKKEGKNYFFSYRIRVIEIRGFLVAIILNEVWQEVSILIQWMIEDGLLPFGVSTVSLKRKK